MSDIIAITDSNKNIVAEYRYDPWGKVLDEDNLTEIGVLNPFRYRSYYYDSDIEMYYLQSRYYDPEVCRFINSDDVNFIGATGTIGSYNAFAYCENNPVNYSDPNGCILITKFPKTWLNNFLRSLIGVEFENEKVIDSIEAIGIKIVLTQVVTKSRNPNAFFTFSNSSINASLGGLNFSLSKLSFSLSAEYSYKGVSVKSFAGASKTYIEFGLLVSQYFKTKNYKRSIGLEIAVQIKRALLKTMAVTIVATSLLLPQTAPFFGKAAIALTQLASSASSSIKTLTSAMLFVIWKAYA